MYKIHKLNSDFSLLSTYVCGRCFRHAFFSFEKELLFLSPHDLFSAMLQGHAHLFMILVDQFAWYVMLTRMQANLGHTMPDGLIVDSDFKENYRT